MQQFHIVCVSSNNAGHFFFTKTITTLQHFATLHHTLPTYTSLHLSTLHLYDMNCKILKPQQWRSTYSSGWNIKQLVALNFRRRIKSRLQFAGIIRSSPYSTRFQDKG